MKFIYAFCALLFFGFTGNGYAEEKSVAIKELAVSREVPKFGGCKQTTTASISVRLADNADSFKALSDKVGQLRDDVMKDAKAVGVSDLKITNSNFSIRQQNNIYNQGNAGPFTLSGNVNFQSEMTEAAIRLAELLSEKDLNVSYSENMRSGYCPRK